MAGNHTYEFGNNQPFHREKKFIVRAAKDLCYPSIVIERLENATTSVELRNIMADARNGKYDDERT